MALHYRPPRPASQRGSGHDWRRVVVGSLVAFLTPLGLAAGAGALIVAIGSGGDTNPLDQHVWHWMVEHRSTMGTDVMRSVTRLGGTAVLVPLTIAGVVLLVVGRRAWLAAYF